MVCLSNDLNTHGSHKHSCDVRLVPTICSNIYLASIKKKFFLKSSNTSVNRPTKKNCSKVRSSLLYTKYHNCHKPEFKLESLHFEGSYSMRCNSRTTCNSRLTPGSPCSRSAGFESRCSNRSR